MESINLARLTSTIDWLEDETRQSKAAVTRIQAQQEELRSYVKDFVDQLRHAEDAITGLRARSSELGTIDEVVTQLRSTVNKLIDQVADLAETSTRHSRGADAEIEKLRGVTSESWSRIDTLRIDLDPLPGRTESLALNQQRLNETIQVAQTGIDQLKIDFSGLGQQLQILFSNQKRLEDRFTDLRTELDELHQKDDELNSNRLILAERVSKLEETTTGLLAEEDARRKLEDQVNLIRVTLTRLEKDHSVTATKVAENAQQIDSVSVFTRQVDSRRESLAERLKEDGVLIQEVRNELAALLADYARMEEQHRVRQIAELQQQLKDVRTRISRTQPR